MNRFCSLLACLAILLTSLPSQAKDCAPQDAPPGVRMPERAGCKARAAGTARNKNASSVKAGREPGFIDLGNGTQVRVGGQVDLEVQHRR